MTFCAFYDDFFDDCLDNFEKVLKRSHDKHLILNWTKMPFHDKKDNCYGSYKGIKVDKVDMLVSTRDLLATLEDY